MSIDNLHFRFNAGKSSDVDFIGVWTVDTDENGDAVNRFLGELTHLTNEEVIELAVGIVANENTLDAYACDAEGKLL